MARINLDQLVNRRRYDKSAATKSQDWFEEQIRYLSNSVSPNSIMNSSRRRDYFVPGQMIMFFYHPKGVDTLPYYDTFPLIIPFSEDAETFTGINFHYLPPKMRAVLLKNLMDFATSKKLDEKTRLKFSWSFIANSARYQGVQGAVKKYRKDHVQSQFLFVPADQWFNAILLPVEKFSTGPNMSRFQKNVVWRDSIGKR
jgi:hypothetical protein